MSRSYNSINMLSTVQRLSDNSVLLSPTRAKGKEHKYAFRQQQHPFEVTKQPPPRTALLGQLLLKARGRIAAKIGNTTWRLQKLHRNAIIYILYPIENKAPVSAPLRITHIVLYFNMSLNRTILGPSDFFPSWPHEKHPQDCNHLYITQPKKAHT
jgi:hypothetical protein